MLQLRFGRGLLRTLATTVEPRAVADASRRDAERRSSQKKKPERERDAEFAAVEKPAEVGVGPDIWV